jgi:hypothetical protein
MPANDWYESHKTDVAAALKKGKTAPHDQPVACTVVRMKDGAHLLCAALVGSKATAMVREARSAGGKVISAGQLFVEDDRVVFEVSEGALPPKAKWTEGGAAVGVPLGNALIRPAPGAAVDAEPGAEPEAPSPPTADGTAALKETLARLVPTIQQAVKDHPTRKNDLLQPIARCKQQLDNGQATEAKATLKEIVGLLKELGHSSAPPVAPPPAAAPPDASLSARDTFMARARELKAAIDHLQATDPAHAAELSHLLVTAAASAKANDFAAAQTTLDAVSGRLAAPPSAPPPPSDIPAFMARARELKAAIDHLQATDPARAAELSHLLVKAAASAKAKDLTAAQATLDAVETALAAPSAGKDQARSTEPPQTAAARWEDQRAIAVAKLQEEIKVVKAIDDPDVGKAELELKAVLKQLNGQMQTQRQAVEMERYLLEDEVVAEVCELAFDLKTPLLRVLKELKVQLPA